MPFGRPKKPSKPQEPFTEARLHDYAQKSLGSRMRSEADLRRLMRAKVEPGEIGAAKINAVVARLKEYGLLNDQAFAENYTQLRQQNEKHGARRVRQDLSHKGIPKEIIEESVTAGYAEIDEETLARQYLARKRIAQPSGPDAQKQTARVMRRLVTAGFSVGVIYKILRQWQVPDEDLAALDNLDKLS